MSVVDFQQKALSSHQTTGSDLGSVVPASHVQGAAVVRDGEYAPSVEKTEALSAGGAVVITRRFSTGLLCYGFVSPYGVFVHDEHNAADASLVDDHILLWGKHQQLFGFILACSWVKQEVGGAARLAIDLDCGNADGVAPRCFNRGGGGGSTFAHRA